MAYFVTGATGFIGRFLVANLLKRGEPIYVLVRKSSLKKLAALREYWGADEKQVIAVDRRPRQEEPRRRRRRPEEAQGQDRALLPSRRDLRPRRRRAEAQQVANVEGTRHAVAVRRGGQAPAASIT